MEMADLTKEFLAWSTKQHLALAAVAVATQEYKEAQWACDALIKEIARREEKKDG